MNYLRRAATGVLAITIGLGFCGESLADRSTLSIDCYGYGSIEHTGTKDLVSVEFFDGNRQLLTNEEGSNDPNAQRWNRWQSPIPDEQCRPGFYDHFVSVLSDHYGTTIRYSNSVGREVKFVQIWVTGLDAFWIDQLRLEWMDHEKREPVSLNWGENEGFGYCLSGDPTDANRTWEPFVGSRGCQPCFEFQVDTGIVVNCPSRLPQERFQ